MRICTGFDLSDVNQVTMNHTNSTNEEVNRY